MFTTCCTLTMPLRAVEAPEVELSFFEYLGSMVEDGDAGWLDPLDMLDAAPADVAATESQPQAVKPEDSTSQDGTPHDKETELGVREVE